MTVYTLFGQGATGASAANDASAYTMGVQFSVSQAGTVTGVWFYSGSGASVLPQTIAVYAVSGASLVHSESASWSGAAASGWVRAAFSSPPSLTPSASYKACVFQSTAAFWYSATSHYWDSGAGASGLTSGIITAPNNGGADGGQDTFNTAGSLAYPASSFNAANYWVDPEVTATPAAVPYAAPPPMPPGRQSPAAWQFLRRPQTGQTSPASITGSGGVTLPKPSLAGSGTVTAGTAAPVSQGSWYQLLDIREQARQEFDAYAERPPVACPLDGEPLRNAPAVGTASGAELFCRFCGWQYPRDWVRPERL